MQTDNDLEDYEDLYPDAEVRGEARAKRAKRPPPTVAEPQTLALGYAVEIDDTTGKSFVGPGGPSPVRFWWAKRATAERLAIAYSTASNRVAILHGERKRSCTSPAKNPWDEGYRASVDGPQCGSSIVSKRVENLTEAREAKAAARARVRETAAAAKADARERKAQRAAKPSFALMPGAAGDVAAVQYLMKHRLDDDRSWEALRYLERNNPSAGPLQSDGGELDVDAVRDLACGLAHDLVHSDIVAARALVRLMGKGRCTSAEELLVRIAKERRELAARIRARGRNPAPRPAPKAKPAPHPELSTRAPKKARAKKAPKPPTPAKPLAEVFADAPAPKRESKRSKSAADAYAKRANARSAERSAASAP